MVTRYSESGTPHFGATQTKQCLEEALVNRLLESRPVFAPFAGTLMPPGDSLPLAVLVEWCEEGEPLP